MKNLVLVRTCPSCKSEEIDRRYDDDREIIVCSACGFRGAVLRSDAEPQRSDGRFKDGPEVQHTYRSMRYAATVIPTYGDESRGGVSDRDRAVLLAMLDKVVQLGKNEIGFGDREPVRTAVYPDGLMPRTTVQRALRSLEREGLIERKQPTMAVNRRHKRRKGKRAPAFYKIVQTYTSRAPVGSADLAEVNRVHGELLETHRFLVEAEVPEDEARTLVNA